MCVCVCVCGGGGGGEGERGRSKNWIRLVFKVRASVSYAKKIREGDPADLLLLLCCAEN